MYLQGIESEYLHGAYGSIQTGAARVSEKSQAAIIYVGTAPVHQVAGGAKNVNAPIAVNSMTEAMKYFGYSDDWGKYTLCEAMHAHLENRGVGPLVLINVLDPAVHKGQEKGSVSLKPDAGRLTIPSAEDIILDSVEIKTADEETTKQKGKDYTIVYNASRKTIIVSELTSGALGTEELKVSYDTIDAAKVQEADVIGSTDGAGLNTGLYAVSNVYQLTGFIPSFLCCPGFSSVPEIHKAMRDNSVKINGHWNAYLFDDLPLTHKETAVNLDNAAKFKAENGYTYENETVYFPMAEGTDGRMYHISVLAAANFQQLLIEQDGVPYKSASNTECELISNLYLGEDYKGRVYDDATINKKLNQFGIASAAYVGGRWAIWGSHSADYNQENANEINVAETNRMMLYYICNDFQSRRPQDVDKPMTRNDLQSIVAEEQARLDALVKIGALLYGEVSLTASADTRSDLMNGDYSFEFAVTTTPLAKSLSAVVRWTDEGFETYFAANAD